ncbi:hypothetical protein PIB30_100859 [Stylosanthes scabra]|uniref:Uncharacterized protein n=1 Tax=Stylosanthes scabra TaxID=79078 RepID=A0ABU6XWF5_9FABA|nr:hypothetical protein [Stylosanthes scabra]
MGPRKEVQKKRRHDGEGSSRRSKLTHPLASWFNNTKALETFITKWEKRQFVSPRRLIEVIENQGFGTLIAMENYYYPDLVIACMSHLKYSASNEGGYIESYIAGRYRVVPLATIANLCGLSMEGHRFMGGVHAHESWGPYELRTGLNAIGYNDPHVGKQRLSVHKLSTKMRILHYLITYTLLPRGGNHGIMQHDDVLLMWAMLEGHKICWPFIMIQNMLSLQGRESKHVGYGPVWTRIFEHLGINLHSYAKVQIGEANLINERTLKQMRRQLEQPAQGVDEVEEEIDRMEQDEQQQAPHFEAQSGSSEQPSMRDMMEILQRMELNQHSLDNRFDGFEQGQERMDRQFQRLNRRLQRIEQKLEINEVEDEEQE